MTQGGTRTRDLANGLPCSNLVSQARPTSAREGRGSGEQRIQAVSRGQGFTLFTDSEVRHVRCDYVMHYSVIVRGVSETQKSKVRAKFM